jgi:6-phosphogluconolactonase
MQLTSYETASEMMQSLSVQIASQLSAAIGLRGRACLAVPGGTTPGPLFDLLNKAELDWANVTVMLTDERWVPTDSARSNTGLIKNRLLVNAARAAQYIALYAEGLDHVAGAQDTFKAGGAEFADRCGGSGNGGRYAYSLSLSRSSRAVFRAK